MKKNITINLFGTLFAIDEDACSLLEQYLDNMKRYFGKREGGDEIADDIERRVTEIFAELNAQGIEAISIEHVQDIIRRIGNPEEMDDGGTPAADASDTADDAANGTADDGRPEPPEPPADEPASRRKSWLANRRLYRDPDDQLLGGVMAGLAKFFGGTDPLPWRIIMVLLAIFSLSTMAIIYLVLWAFVPVARTAEERLRMQGKPVNPVTLNEELMAGARRAQDYVKTPSFRNSARGCLGTLVAALVFCLKFGLVFVAAGALLTVLGLTFMLGYATLFGVEELVRTGVMDAEFLHIVAYFPSTVWVLWLIAVFSIVACGLLLYGVLRWILHRPESRPVRTGTTVTLVVIFLISVAAAISLGILACVQLDHADDEMERTRFTRNGVFLYPGERDLLASQGWSLPVYVNANRDGYIVERCHSFTTDGTERYFEFKRNDDNLPMKVRAERAVDYPAGRYRLEAVAFSQGNGTYIYALTAAGDTIMQAVPMDDMDGRGTMKNLTLEEARATQVYDDSMSVETFEEVRDRAKGWSYVRTPAFYHAGGPLRYGITNDSGFTHAASTVVNKIGLKDVFVVPAPAAPVSAAQ